VHHWRLAHPDLIQNDFCPEHAPAISRPFTFDPSSLVVPANTGTHTPRLFNIRTMVEITGCNPRRWLWVPAFAGTTAMDDSTSQFPGGIIRFRSRDTNASGCCKLRPSSNRGRRESRMPITHPQPRAQKQKAHEQSHRRFDPVKPAFPARMVLTVSFVLSPVIGLSCHRRWPRCESILANLMPASRHQNHTTSPSANRRIRQLRSSRPSHPAPNVRDDREAPLLRARDARINAGDLPDGATARACDQLARRANHLPRAKSCQAQFLACRTRSSASPAMPPGRADARPMTGSASSGTLLREKPALTPTLDC
jgi:hypothetical protein